MSDLVENPEDRFSHNEAHFILGDHLLDDVAFAVTLIDENTVEVKWAVFPNASGYDLNSTLTYHAASIGDCQSIETPEKFNEYV